MSELSPRGVSFDARQMEMGTSSQEAEAQSLSSIIIAEPHGYCGGVRPAVARTTEIVYIANLFGENVYTFNPIIHNRRLNEKWAAMGLVTLTDRDPNGDWVYDQVPNGSLVTISAHGAKPQDYERLAEKDCTVFDTTCVLVDNEHEDVERALESGHEVILFGRSGHAESRGTLGYGSQGKINFVTGEEDMRALEIDPEKTYELFRQTTLSTKEMRAVNEIARGRIPNVFFDEKRLGCYATDHRQLAVQRLIDEHLADAVLVVGDGELSNNTKSLAGVGPENGVPSWIVNDPGDIDWDWFRGIKNLGVSSSASALETTLESVIREFETRGIDVRHQIPVVKENMSASFPLKRAELAPFETRYGITITPEFLSLIPKVA